MRRQIICAVVHGGAKTTRISGLVQVHGGHMSHKPPPLVKLPRAQIARMHRAYIGGVISCLVELEEVPGPEQFKTIADNLYLLNE